MIAYCITVIPACIITATIFGEKGCDKHPIMAGITVFGIALGIFSLLF